jgi:hypothetical protein
MIAIPALHDAANDHPIPYIHVCSHAAIPVCLHPAYTVYLPAVTAALEPVLSEVAGLPGAPVRISQVAATFHQGPGNSVDVNRDPAMSGGPSAFRLLLPVQTMTTSELAATVRSDAGPNIVANVIGGGPGASPAQQAVVAALMKAAGVPQPPSPGRRTPEQLPAPVRSAAQRFAALPAAVRHGWLTQHLAALRAGRISLAQLP